MRINAARTLLIAASLFAVALPAFAQPAQQYTDAQLQAYMAASREIEPISNRVAQMTPQQRTQATAQIRTILRRHNLTGDQYNAIEIQSGADAALARRIADLRVQNLSDDMLRRFVAAAAEIDPISRSLTADATETQRAQASAQIRAVLDRHEMGAATYNAIAARAQSDQALAERIAELQRENAADAGSEP
jgi:hypothetical protein